MTELVSVDIQRILEMIPHRYPFLLIDKVVDIAVDDSAVGIKNVTMNEPQFTGHFPEQPIMPGVLIIESMAQTAAILVVQTLGEDAEGKLVYFMSIDNARFRKPVVPGDVMHIHVKKKQSRGPVWKFESEVRVNDQVVAEATIAAMIRGN
ncbi:3-hydroxyacyl-[acyl-carrier-protein] dehydratase [Thalassospira sp. MBR-102]|jgi:3-hydroxyacyl-[acyl-carrier-protein] dehydratase|uniref:3-hydroxyacyl-[acyl-carrier-protein] dehydratase FabZ n=6 Tax=Thalassospira TaxID=168934 RepID=A0A154VUQ7_9PROT|nr:MULTISPECIES: 3-hydroxyacyl-ACP dehydratase FabZ [Thalassospira]MBR9780989.1 3-hydroxyacyl-ACP dehydratase FabZ [Rhodospirillales bacterium]PTB87583.1 3-hydroxyacyl-[acyl-carrier-protein] dehydratase FabZ [Pseudidiomarina aestuarii]UKV16708.1 3-hydroxyacyl-ACP dehydratase FabZ [Thalassospiraceae bacterium SW-3-3]AJD52207.1 beta-hydroxyacyl-(acyl-carrier-protein) dehydratase FabZ [Thalassospira xiamenensis M-5 = DSM 17429]KEO53624.1 3-hydroxyacyl-ACP dehydratase [Thalassospira permensis NBRC|tara:strand:- start:303 stop:752 length:450 start_codon:yes stop_codon:yes gene_type:complete